MQQAELAAAQHLLKPLYFRVEIVYNYGLRASEAYLPSDTQNPIRLDNDGDVPKGDLHGPVELLVDCHVHHLVLALQDAFLLGKKLQNRTIKFTAIRICFCQNMPRFGRSGSIYV
jgi:hypothetical protein